VLVGANLAVPAPAGVELRTVETAAELDSAVRAAALNADVVVMAAAVADFRPVVVAEHKIKKTAGEPAPILLERTADVLSALVSERRPGQLVVGFAAETGDDDGDVADHGRAKAIRKGADLLVVNAVGDGRGFGTPDNDVTILDGTGTVIGTAAGSKAQVADAVWDAVVARLTPDA
ncbi:hypothetical protein N867_09310, partial [Actinotalea fermentans ATCC 43279 = JCM 9966 = DSM 3133]